MVWLKTVCGTLLVFGCQAYVHVQKKKHISFEPKSRRCIFLGYPPDYKGWKVYDPLTWKITISRDIIFDEQSMPGMKTSASDTFYISLPSNLVPESGGEQSHSHRFLPLRYNDNDTLTSEPDSESLPPSNPILPPSHSIPSPSPEPQNSPSPPPLPCAPSTSSSTQPTWSSTQITAGKHCPDWFKVTHPVGSGPFKWLGDYREPTPPVESDSSGSEYAASQVVALVAKSLKKELSTEEVIVYAFATSTVEPKLMKEAKGCDESRPPILVFCIAGGAS